MLFILAWLVIRAVGLSGLACYVLNVAPWARRSLWKVWYNAMARNFSPTLFFFMNYGLKGPRVPSFPASLVLPQDATSAALYAAVAAPAALPGARVFEVGCGRGGGAAFLTALHRPARFTAMDYAPAAVALASHAHARAAPRLAFEVGDAERLRFADASFDVVINVESSHCYGDVAVFFAEVARVLAPGGRFAFAGEETPFAMCGCVCAWRTAGSRIPATGPLVA